MRKLRTQNTEENEQDFHARKRDYKFLIKLKKKE